MTPNVTNKVRIYNGEKTVSSISGCYENWTAISKRTNQGHFLTSYTKINAKRIKEQNARLYIIKILKKNTGRALFDINHRNIFGFVS